LVRPAADGTVPRKVKIVLDSDRCQGHGRCYDLAPELFGADDDGHSVVLVPGEIGAEQEQAATVAVQNCPERALTREP
jgi:ferredoxin